MRDKHLGYTLLAIMLISWMGPESTGFVITMGIIQFFFILCAVTRLIQIDKQTNKK